MSKQHIEDPLEQMWQAQSVHSLDMSEIEKHAKSQRTKQRFYIALDVLSLSPFAVLLLIDTKLSFAFYVFLACIFVSSAIMVAYFVKLRWLAAFGTITDLNDFTHTLIKQYKNNALIAKINKHVGWLSIIMCLCISFILQLTQNKELKEAISTTSAVFALALAFGIPWCIWAHKRQKRFETQASKLEAMIE